MVLYIPGGQPDFWTIKSMWDISSYWVFHGVCGDRVFSFLSQQNPHVFFNRSQKSIHPSSPFFFSRHHHLISSINIHPSFSFIQDQKGIIKLADALQENKSLRVLMLSKNGITAQARQSRLGLLQRGFRRENPDSTWSKSRRSFVGVIELLIFLGGSKNANLWSFWGNSLIKSALFRLVI